MVRLPQILTLVALVAGVPLFLRSPVWADLTLYDVAAQAILRGGVHYRDVFDTNLPGFVWCLTLLRAVVGPGFVAVRAADLVMMATVVYLADRLAKRCGASASSRWWSIAAIALWYPFFKEGIHCQRDTWMGVPALAAVLLRVRRFGTEKPAFRAAFVEGVLWGFAVWIKPHLVPVALAVWLATMRPLSRGKWRAVLHDLLGNLAGGGLIGGLGILWLISTGAWLYFLDVFTTWNTGYLELVMAELKYRCDQELFWFPPWSVFLVPTVVLAVVRIVAAIRGGLGTDIRFTRFTLSVLYLAWVAQTFFLQRGFQYVHTVETVLMFAMWAAWRPWLPILGLSWIAISSLLWLVSDAYAPLNAALWRWTTPDFEQEPLVMRHPLADPGKMWNWGHCLRPDLTPLQRNELRDILCAERPHEAAPAWVEMAEVAEFLRQQGVKDGEVVAWHDSPHVVYLMLNVKPGVRFMHVNTVQMINERAVQRTQEELEAAAPKLRFAVSDLQRVAHFRYGEHHLKCLEPGPSATDLLPPRLPVDHRKAFPYCQPAIFRSKNGKGRYIVHRIEQPIGDGRIPP